MSSELHIAQQSRRDKLRINQQDSTATQDSQEYTYNWEVQLPIPKELNPADHTHQLHSCTYASVTNEPTMLCSEMVSFPTYSRALLRHNDQISSKLSPSAAKVNGDPQDCSTWKSIGSQQSFDWIDRNSSGSRAIDSNQNPTFAAESNYQYIHQISRQNTLQELVTCASTGILGPNTRETCRGSWSDRGSELLPTYGDQSNIDNASDSFMNLPVEGCYQWHGQFGFPNSMANGTPNTRGLSLSLSSFPPSKTPLDLIDESRYCKDLQSSTVVFNDSPDIVGTSTFSNQNAGPLGPFTGYATILKTSKFLKPAQLILEEFCGRNGFQERKEVCDQIYEEIRVSDDTLEATESVIRGKGGDSGASTSTFYSSNEIYGEAGGGGRSFCESYRPDPYQPTKAKLLYMQDEVCGKYKQYQQQMQMVVSSFESVAGLSSAVPYFSLALKTVSRHFRCLKNAVSDHLIHTKNVLKEDLSSPNTGTSNTKVDASTSKLKLIDHRYQKHNSGGNGVGFLEFKQHVWRPQRGLPEHAVAILKAWLFDHFLHPYPTDTDKHMLATQTGLSRNQVSNWFINARVRIWKPMVEEIHMLETKGLAETNVNSGKTDGNPTIESASQHNGHQSVNRLRTSLVSDKKVNCTGIGSSSCMGDELRNEPWNHEKRARVDCQVPASMGGSLVGFVPCQQSGIEFGGVGAVSLTLGLR